MQFWMLWWDSQNQLSEVSCWAVSEIRQFYKKLKNLNSVIGWICKTFTEHYQLRSSLGILNIVQLTWYINHGRCKLLNNNDTNDTIKAIKRERNEKSHISSPKGISWVIDPSQGVKHNFLRTTCQYRDILFHASSHFRQMIASRH